MSKNKQKTAGQIAKAYAKTKAWPNNGWGVINAHLAGQRTGAARMRREMREVLGAVYIAYGTDATLIDAASALGIKIKENNDE